MFATIKREYVSNKYYTGMYIHMVSNQIISTVITIFTGPFLFSIGDSLPLIFSFYCLLELIFVLGLFIMPLIVNKFGYNYALIASYVSGIMFFLCIGGSVHFTMLILPAALFQGVQKSLYYPVADTLQASFIDTANRGKQLSVQSVLTSLAGALTAFITGWLLSRNLYVILLGIVLIFIILAISPLFIVFTEYVQTNVMRLTEVYTFIIAKDFKKRLIQTLGLSTSNTILGTILSLYIFLYLKNLSLLGAVVVIAMLVQLFSSLYLGRIIDSRGRKAAMQKTTLLASIGNLSLIFLNQSALVVSIILVYMQTTFTLFINAYDVNYNDKAKESNQPFLYSLSVLIVMGVAGVVLFGLLAILACFTPVQVLFQIIFLLSLTGMFVNLIYFQA